MVPAASTLRGFDSGQWGVFGLHFEWTGPQRTSLHKHRGWELVLVRGGLLSAVIDGQRRVTGAGAYLELPAGSVHAIWSSGPVSFDVLGEVGLGLWMVVPDESGGMREVPVYDPDGPWQMHPPAGASYTTPAQADQLRALSQTLF